MGSRGKRKGKGGKVSQDASAASTSGRGEKAARSRLAGEDFQEFRTCARKRRYQTSVEARKAAEQASRRKDAPKIYVYRCEYCGGWHLTHRKPRS